MNRRVNIGFYIYRFLSDFMPAYALYALFFQSKGITDASISVLFIVLSLSTLVLELPTGAFADLVDRRIPLTLSALAKALGFCAWMLWPTHIGFAIGMVVWGLGVSLESGCWQAFIYDELTSQGKNKAFGTLIARLLGVSFLATLFSGIVGSILFYFFQDYSLILLVSIVATVMASFVPFLFFPAAARREQTISPSLSKHIAEVRSVWRRSSLSKWLVISAAFMGGIKGSLDEYHGLLLSQKMIPTEIVPLFYAGFTLTGALLFFFISRHQRSPKTPHIAWLMAIVGALLFSVAWLPTWVCIIALFAMNAVDSIVRVDTEAMLQSSIDSDAARATITSASSFSLQLVSIIAFGLSALITTYLPFTALYLVGGVVLILVAAWQWNQARAKFSAI